MATISPSSISCPKETSTEKGAYLRLNITSITQTDGATNQTTINWSITVHGTPYVWLYGVEAKLGGKTLYSYKKTTPLIESWTAGKVVKSGSTTFNNNDDGSLVLEGSLQQLFYYGYNATRWGDSKLSQKVSGTFTCSSIPRANEPSCENVTLGNLVTIYTNRASELFTHTIVIKESGETFTNVGESVQWTPSISKYAPLITVGRTGTFTIESTTYQGTTLIGTKTSKVILTVPTTVKPTASVSIAEADSTMIAKAWGVYVKNKSKLAVTVSGTPAYSSAIKSYSSTVEGVTKSGSSVTSNVLTIVGTNTVKAKVTDNRDITSNEVSQSYTVVDYFKPAISSKSVARCNADGTDNDEGTYVKYSFVASIAPVNNKNTKVFRLGYRLKSDSSFNYIVIENSAYSVNKNNVVLSNIVFDNNSSYVFRFEATDAFETLAIEDEIGTGFDIINVHRSGKSMAIGKISEATDDQELLEVGLETEFKNTVDVQNNLKAQSLNVDSTASVGSDLTVGGHTKSNSLEVSGNVSHGKYITADPTSNFKTSIFGNANSRMSFKPFRNNSFVSDIYPKNCAGFCWSMGDTHGFLLPRYDTADIIVGGGNKDVINWTKHLAFKDDIIAMGDYVVEQGTSDIWTYRKWSSGIAECWGQPNITTYSGNGTTRILVSTSDSYKTYYYQIDVPLPSGLFTSVNCVNATAIDAGTGTSACCVESWSATTFRMVTWGSTASANNGRPCVHVFGRWK